MKTNSGYSLENNVSAFNADTNRHGGYVYSAVERWSSLYATGRQTDELVRMLKAHFPQSIRIADIGCGDGTYTLELAIKFGPQGIRAVDPASKAIEVAQKKVFASTQTSVSFEVGNIYDVKSNGEDLAVVRGVLHHLDNPQAAIAHLATQFRTVFVLEPNGYNPVMKLIERLSTYHRQHDEKSYWPPALNQWFQKAGFAPVEQQFFCLVPYFCPTPLAKILRMLEPVVEAIPGVRQISTGTNLILYRS
jgi:ubiquinone/menaquinone biosynthesis C-methylase UbiE